MEKVVHGKFEIRYDEDKEVWYTHVKAADGNLERTQQASLKKLKAILDKADKKKFERLPVLVKTDYGYGSRDDRYKPQYEEAVITSISPGGRLYFVRKGKKSAEQAGYWRDDMAEDTPANRALIAEIEKQGKIEFEADKAQEVAKKKLKVVDPKKLFTQLYGRES